MNKIYRIFLPHLIIFFAIVLYSCENRQNNTNNLSQNSNTEEYDKIEVKLGKKSYKVSLNYKVNKQSMNERKFIDINTRHLFKIGSINDTLFSYPTFVKTDIKGNIYVLDMADHSVKKFDREGVFIRKYGRMGKGPGEFISPFRIDVSDSGKLLVLDPNLNRCELFEGDKIKQFTTNVISYAACFVGSMSFVTLQILDPFENSALIKYNIETGNSIECQNLILDNNDVNLGALPFLNGDILGIDKKSFLYVPEFMNHFIKYSNEGKIIFARNTIDKIKLPIIQRDNSNRVDFRLPQEYISSLYAFVVGNKFYNVSFKASEKKSYGKDYVVDSYSLSNGEYIYSFKLHIKEVLRNIYMDKERIYLLKDNLELEVLNYKISL